MKPTFQENGVEIYQGDCRDVLRSLPDESVNCVVTSPHYWGLRDYGTASWDGGSAECDHTNGPLASPKSTLQGYTGDHVKLATGGAPFRGACGKCGATRIDRQIGLEDSPVKYIATMREVFAEVRRVLRSDGTLWLNMGDSYSGSWANYGGGDRGAGKQRLITKGSSAQNPVWEGLEGYRPPASFKQDGLKPKDLVGIPWMLAFALREDGWYLRQDIIWSKPNPMPESVTDRCTKAHEYIFLLSKSERYYYNQEAVREPQTESSRERALYGWNGRTDDNSNGARTGSSFKKMAESGEPIKTIPTDGMRNKRSVWEITTYGFPEAHFATFPEDLIKPCILAGCVEGGIVLDPFGGSGTTAKVARELHCKAILVELNPDYIQIAARRLGQHVFNFSENRAGGVAPAGLP